MLHLFVPSEVPGVVIEGKADGMRIVTSHFSSHIENRQIAHNRYQGNLAGFGISYGYQWIISPQWNLEAGISLGYAHLNYKRYGQSEGAALLEKSSCNYWGPTQAGISIIYFIR